MQENNYLDAATTLYACLHTRTLIHTYTYLHLHTYTHACAHTYMHTHKHTHTHIHTYVEGVVVDLRRNLACRPIPHSHTHTHTHTTTTNTTTKVQNPVPSFFVVVWWVDWLVGLGGGNDRLLLDANMYNAQFHRHVVARFAFEFSGAGTCAVRSRPMSTKHQLDERCVQMQHRQQKHSRELSKLARDIES